MTSVAMRYKWLSTAIGVRYVDAHRYDWMKQFKWEWSVSYEFNWTGEWEKGHRELFPDRESARQYIRKQMMCHRGLTRPVPFTCFRNIRMQRRLVQARWEDYNDSYGWNKGNGKR